MRLLREAAPLSTIAIAVAAAMSLGILMGATTAVKLISHELGPGGCASAFGVYSIDENAPGKSIRERCLKTGPMRLSSRSWSQGM